MKIAIISDIHGNLPALEAVLHDIQQRDISSIYCLGDLVGKGPHPAEVVDLVRQHCLATVKGNWDDYMATQSSEMIDWAKDQLGTERLEYLDNLPVYLDILMSGKRIRLCHASPHNMYHRTYLTTSRDERLGLFEPVEAGELEADVIGYGDIHGAHVDHFNGKTIFNTGSIGNPLEIPQASYAILEGSLDSPNPEPFLISIARIPYDIERAVQDAEESTMPEKDAYIIELRTAIYRKYH